MPINEKLKKLLLQTVVLPSVFVLISVVLFFLLYSRLSSSNHWLDHSNAVVQDLGSLRADFYRYQSQLRGYVISRDPGFLGDITATNSLLRTADRLVSSTRDNRAQNERIMDLRNEVQAWTQYAREVWALMEKKPNEGAKLVASGVGQKITDQFSEKYNLVVQEEQRLRHERKESNLHDFQLIAFLFLPIVLLFSTIFALQGRASLTSLSNSYDDLIAEREKSSRRQEKEARLRILESRVLEQIMDSGSFAKQAVDLLGFFCDEFQVRVGAVYVNEGNGHFRLQTSIGFNDGQVALSEFSHNQTALAQAVRRPRPQILGNFEEEKWRVRSGIADLETRQVILMPLSYNNQLIAIAELGMPSAKNEEILEFMALTADKIASLLANNLAREKLETLYSELQAQSEELQAQSEELQAQQEELRTSNEELQSQAATLEEQKEQLNLRNINLAANSREIAHQKKELERVSQYKSQFLANMSHELRTPLNSSMVLAQLLSENADGNLTERQIEMTNQIYKSGGRLLLLINDILDLSKVESGILELKRSKFAVPDMMGVLEKTFEPMARQKKIQLSFHLDSQIPEIDTDRLRLEQILTNFISNAIKFTDKGGVTVDVKFDDAKYKRPTILFAVSDTGVGIRSEELDTIFEPFRQLEGQHHGKQGGTGLGLSIARQLANLLGAHIEVQSEVGRGSVFRLYVPVDFTSSNHESPSIVRNSGRSIAVPVPLFSGTVQEVSDDRYDLQGQQSVLVVEDDLEFARILRDHIRQAGFQCLVATRAEEALSLAREYLPSAVILDNQLPDESGLYVLSQLKDHPGTQSIPVHFISVTDFSSQAKNLGAEEYLLKPVDLKQIKDLLNVIRSTKSELESRVLIVEDDGDQAMAISGAFKSQGVQSVHARSGEEALEILVRDGRNFDSMVLDFQLGDMTGLNLLKRIEEKSEIEVPPVVIYTGHELTKNEEAELKKLTKSIILKGSRSQERLLDEVSRFLHKEIKAEKNGTKAFDRRNQKKLEGLKILIVDDDMRNIFSLTAALEQQGAVTLMAKNGVEALRLVKEKTDLDFILMDIMMPEMDGFEAMTRIRNDLGRKTLPIVALTAKGMKNDRDLCLQAGANDYLAKPVDLQKLYSLIRIWSARVI